MTKDEIKNALIERDGLKCMATGEFVSEPSQLSIHRIFPSNNKSQFELSNFILVKNAINAELGNRSILDLINEAANSRGRREMLASLESHLHAQEKEYRKRFESMNEELEAQRNHFLKERIEIEKNMFKEVENEKKRLIQKQEELERARFELKREESKAEERYRKQYLEDVKSLLNERETFEAVIKEKETRIQVQLREFDEMRSSFELDKIAKEESIRSKLEEVEKEKSKYLAELKAKFEKKSSKYVLDATEALKKSGWWLQFHGIAWATFGAFALASALFLTVYFTYTGISDVKTIQQITWPAISFLAFKGLIIVGLCVVVAKYAFVFGQSYIHEALKTKERIHAINFGNFYLESFGANADWIQVKEAFANWNIQSSSAFFGNDPEKLESKMIEKFMCSIESLAKSALDSKKKE